jgi:TDG/mug DNA glycosylase family protein
MHQLETLPDYLRPGLDIVSIGLNPSLPSVRAGFYFANPRNRFWRALNASGLLQAPVAPAIAAMQLIFERDGIGFTDVVKRPTAGGGELRAADYRAWAPLLYAKLLRYAPGIAWFQGKQACLNYFTYGEDRRVSLDWGLQPFSIGASRVFVTPNPSPANAAFALDELVGWMCQLAALRAQR